MEKVKIYLDDVRPCPKGWVLAKTAWECIDLLQKCNGFTIALSLDHDLGDESNGTGYDVVKWIEERQHDTPVYYITPSIITIHSANPVGIAKMKAGIESIYRMKI